VNLDAYCPVMNTVHSDIAKMFQDISVLWRP